MSSIAVVEVLEDLWHARRVAMEIAPVSTEHWAAGLRTKGLGAYVGSR